MGGGNSDEASGADDAPNTTWAGTQRLPHREKQSDENLCAVSYDSWRVFGTSLGLQFRGHRPVEHRAVLVEVVGEEHSARVAQVFMPAARVRQFNLGS